jgi:hypothetical protein
MFTTIAVIGVLTQSRTVSNTGTVQTIGFNVYSDSACTNPLTSINWGNVTPNSNYTFTLYALDSGNVNIVLSMSTNTWNPSTASNYLSLSWNYISGTVLTPNESVPIILTLTVGNIQGITSFSFNILMVGTQQ